METLVRRLRRIFSRKTKNSIPRISDRMSRKMDRLEQSLPQWIERKRWRVPSKSLSEAAEELGTDTETLHHYFQKRLGIDFRTWRTRLRLEDAMQLLLEEPELPVSMISRRCGFSDRSNFSRQFLFHTGMTPAKWRKEAGKSHDIPAPENDYV